MLRRVVSFSLLVVTLVAGGTIAPTPDTDTAAAQVATPIEWSPCGFDVECGLLEVPLDHADPTGPTIEIAVSRIPATDPDQRRGVLLLNPGGPGAGGLGLRLPLAQERYDQIGFDPRGTGDSTPLPCSQEAAMAVELLASPPRTSDERQAWTDAAAAFEASCRTGDPDLFDHVGTVAVARDMDLIRQALGEDRISFYGASYGTFLGAVYADLFPGRVDKFILDGPLDPSDTPEELNLNNALGSEEAFEHWAELCEADRNCAFNDGTDVGERTARLVQRFADDPAAYRPDPDGPPVGAPVDGARVSTLIFGSLFQNEGWPKLGQLLAGLEAGDVEAAAFVSVDSVTIPAYWPISRASGIMPGDPAEIDAVAGPAPVMGPGLIRENRFSAMMDVPVEPRDRPVDAPGAPPILVIASRWDPATSYVWARSLSTNLDSGVLVTWNGATHVALLTEDPCLERIASDYLDDVATPSRAEGARCDTATLAASTDPDLGPWPQGDDPVPEPAPTTVAIPAFTG